MFPSSSLRAKSDILRTKLNGFHECSKKYLYKKFIFMSIGFAFLHYDSA